MTEKMSSRASKDSNDPSTRRAKGMEKKVWFHGMLPREDIARMLKEQGQFLVRITEPKKGEGLRKVLSVFWDGKVHHYIIVELKDGAVSIEQLKFGTIVELVEYYQTSKKPISSKSGAKLLHVVPKQNWELHHDQIEIGKMLGEGAFGAVHIGTLKLGSENIKVAVKVSKTKALNKDMIKEICKEARIMRQYTHPNVVRFYGIAVEQEPMMLVMELVDGGSLDSYLVKNSTTLTPFIRVRMCLDVARGLEYLHDKGCIHRDVAARNCLVSEGHAKISDFGLSRELSKNGAKYKISDLKQKLPIRWLAPETLSTATYTSKSDVFSYGIFLWEVFSDAAEPYAGMTVAEVNVKVKSGYRMDAPSNMPSDLQKVMTERCFPGNADERWSMTQVRKALEALCNSTASDATNKSTLKGPDS